MTKQKNPVALMAQNMAQQKNPGDFAAQKMAQQKTPVFFLWHRIWHRRKSRWFLMAQQKTPVVFGGTENGTTPGDFCGTKYGTAEKPRWL